MTPILEDATPAPTRCFHMSLGNLLGGAGLVTALALVLWMFLFHSIGALFTVVGGLAFLGLALMVVGLYVAFTDLKYELDADGLRRRRGRRLDFVAWEDISPFSETEPTHREGDRHCYLKDREGTTLMAVSDHLLADNGAEMLTEVRERIGPPVLPEGGGPDVFQFRHFTGGMLFRVELTDEDVAAVNRAGEMRIPYEAVEQVIVRSWPEYGTGLERAKIIGDGKLVEFDSRLVGFWPLVDHVLAAAPEAEFVDESRRGQERKKARPGPQASSAIS